MGYKKGHQKETTLESELVSLRQSFKDGVCGTFLSGGAWTRRPEITCSGKSLPALLSAERFFGCQHLAVVVFCGFAPQGFKLCLLLPTPFGSLSHCSSWRCDARFMSDP